MITCAITAESKRALRKAIGSILTERINQKSKFDLKDITKDVYDIIFTSTSEHAQGLNYARSVPEIILQLRNHDTDVKTYLRGSLDAVGDIQYEFEKEDGLKAVEDFLGVNIDIPGVLKSEQPRYTSEEEREAAPKQEPLTPEDFTPTSFQKGDRVKINDEIGGEANVIEDRGNEVLLDNGRPPILKKNLELILPTQGVLQPTEKGSADDLQGKGRTEPILTQPTTTTTKSQTETVDNQDVQPQITESVAELFDENPNLANAVYESLGFGKDVEAKKAEIERRRREKLKSDSGKIADKVEIFEYQDEEVGTVRLQVRYFRNGKKQIFTNSLNPSISCLPVASTYS